jgi:hypothetical protein
MGGRDEVFDLAQVRVGKDVVIAGGHVDKSACCPVCGSDLLSETREPKHTTVPLQRCLVLSRYDKYVQHGQCLSIPYMTAVA